MSRQVRKKKLYLGSALRNRNGTSKLIDYKRGQNCICRTKKIILEGLCQKNKKNQYGPEV